jgi:hypothetical protein
MGGGVKDERAQDLKALGLPDEQISKIVPPAPQNDDFEVLEENWESVQFFLQCQTQWRVGGMGGVIGLDYSAIAFLFSIYKPKKKHRIMQDLQLMEKTVLAEQAKNRG